MKIECEVRVKREPRLGMEIIEAMNITLEGDFEAIVALLRKVNFNQDMAKELCLK